MKLMFLNLELQVLETFYLKLLPLSFIFLLSAFFANAQFINTSDKDELLTLYNQQPPSIKASLSNWGSDKMPWEGVSTNADGRVVKIELVSKELIGIIPDFSLPYLQVLQLSFNKLSGVVPNFNLPNLVQLSISSNRLNGNIPDFILPKLEVLTLHDNNLSGQIPDFKLPNLKSLGLSNNKLSGNIPNFSSPRLSSLNLSSNQLTGYIPNFYNLSSLTNLNLGFNQLSGAIPKLILPNLETLDLGNNLLTGSIPEFDLPKLKYLYLFSNQLENQLPLFNSSLLKKIFVDDNKLSGQLPNIQSNELQAFHIQANLFNFSSLESITSPSLISKFKNNNDFCFTPQAKILLEESSLGVLNTLNTGGDIKKLLFNWHNASRPVRDTSMAVVKGDSKISYLAPKYLVFSGDKLYDSVTHIDWQDGLNKIYLLSNEFLITNGLPSIFVTALLKPDRTLQLNWVVSSEVNCDYYIVESGLDSAHLKKISTVQTKAKEGNSIMPLQYEFSSNGNVIAGFGIIGISLFLFRRRRQKYFLPNFLLVFILIIACNKKDVPSKTVKQDVYVRVIQVAKNGDSIYSNVIKAIPQ